MLKTSAILLTIWSCINFILALIIIIFIVILHQNAPILEMIFTSEEIITLSKEVLLSVNVLAILYNSGMIAVSISVICIIWKCLINKQKWAFWCLLFVIGFVQFFGLFAFSMINNERWQVNVPLTIIYIIGIIIAGNCLFIKYEK